MYLVLQDAPVLINEHTLLHLCEDLGLVRAKRVLVTLVQVGCSHEPRKALSAIVGTACCARMAVYAASLSKLKHRFEERTLECLLLHASEREQVA